MRIVKPLNISVLHRTYQLGETHHLCVKPVLFFDLLAPRLIVSEVEGWRKVMSVLPQYQVLDEAMPKAQPEALVLGHAYSPSGNPVSVLEAGFSVGDVEKKLSISGDRIWQKNRWWGYRQTPPANFTSMPLTWGRAYGHADSAENPVGQGALSTGDFGETIVALPNIEYPQSRLKSPKAKVQAAGFGPVDSRWAPRSTYDSAFDQTYLDEVFPGLPDSLNFARFNMAPEDQQARQFSGSDPFRLWNLHAQQAELTGLLPGLLPRVFTDEPDVFKEIPVSLETVWFFPDLNLGAMIYCGTRIVERRYAQLQLSNLLLAYEDSAGQCRTTAEYESILRQRTDNKTGSLHALDESQLSPVVSQALQTQRAEQHSNEVARINQLRQSSWEKYRSNMAAEHDIEIAEDAKSPEIDPRLVVAPDAVARRDYSLVPVHEYVQEQTNEAEKSLNEAREKARAETAATVLSEQDVTDMALARTRDQKFAASGLDAASVKDDTAGRTIPPAGELIKLELQALALALAPQQLSYRKAADAGQSLRQAVSLSQSNGESLAFRDFTGADLHEFDFSGADCSGSIFECANLEGCNFAGARLAGASFVGAKLSNCDFSKATLKDANFSQASGDYVVFCAAELSGRVMMYQTRFMAADFNQAILHGVSIQKSKLPAADFSGASMAQIVATDSEFKCGSFVDVAAEGCAFSACDFNQTEWSGVKAHRCVFLNCQLQLCYFNQSTFERCQLAGDSWLTASSFMHSQFGNCGLRSSKGAGVVFINTFFRDSDMAMIDYPCIRFESSGLVNCLANESNFSFGSFASSLLVNTSLMDSRFVEVELHETDFYQSDVLLTDFEGTDVSAAKNLMPTKLMRMKNAG